ncbi:MULTISPECIES: FecR family protein [Flavobacteriaceae]|uniref:FecR family protein n=1 Tax=Flavobacteriaceae TaxID=49546 RepID=UPI001491D1D5|nr:MULTISPECIES: FecR domain-containing protein [Allomuricauda]MDC6366623.1 FecR domain-containing protein [Muricauda sp. AC10]
MTEKEIKDLIEKYLNGTISKTEEQLLEQFDGKLIEKHIPTLANLDEEHQTAKKRLVESTERLENQGGFKNRVLQIAASVVLLFSLGYLAYKNIPEQPQPEIAEVQILEKHTEWGQKLNVVLPDGTSVKLNSGSTLSFPESFQGDTREVVLQGEAFFDVVKNPNKPFIITSGELKTTVLGTSFNINAYGHTDSMAVTVLTGKVSVESSLGQVYLLPNEQGVMDKASQHIEKEKVDVSEVLLWKDGVLKFEDAPLGQVADALERWYGVTVEFENEKAAACTLTGTYDNEYLKAVLESIVFAKKSLKYQFMDDNTVLILGMCN